MTEPSRFYRYTGTSPIDSVEPVAASAAQDSATPEQRKPSHPPHIKNDPNYKSIEQVIAELQERGLVAEGREAEDLLRQHIYGLEEQKPPKEHTTLWRHIMGISDDDQGGE